MDDGDARDYDRDLTRSERWARFVARQASGTLWSLAFLGVAVMFLVLGDWELALIFAILSPLYWERTGFRRLLARREAEISRLRSGSGSA